MATETNNLMLNKPHITDFYNIDLVNANMDKIDGAIAGKVDKKDIPTSLPANGGNADTVDGKHASDFLEKNTITNFPNWDLNELSNMDTDFYSIQPSGATNPTRNTPFDGWGVCFHIKYGSTSHQTAFYSNGNKPITYRRSFLNDSWTSWEKANDGGNADTVDGYHAWQQQCLSDAGIAYSYWSFLQWDGAIGYFRIQVDGADGSRHKVHVNNADTVDNYHVDLGTHNTYGLRPIAMDTFDLSPGNTPMTPGHIYIMYE